MKNNKKQQLINFIKEKIDRQEYIIEYKEINKNDLSFLLNELNLIKKLARGFYLIFLPNWKESFFDVISNLYNEQIINYFLQKNNAFLGEKESYNLYIWNTSSKFINVSSYKKKGEFDTVFEIEGWIKINLQKKIDLKFPLNYKIVNHTRFELMNPLEILYRMSDKRTSISKDKKFKEYVINTFSMEQSFINKIKSLPSYKSPSFKKMISNILYEFKNTKLEKKLKDIFSDLTIESDEQKEDVLSLFSQFDNSTNSFEKSEFEFLNLTDFEKRDEFIKPYLSIFDSVFEILDEFKSISEITYEKELLIELAKQNKKNDVYHSTTIEWYKITKNDVDVFLWYKSADLNDKTLDELEKIVAVKGYALAFDFILKHPVDTLSEDFLFDIYQNLWYYSFEFNWIDIYQQRQYRTTQKFMRGSVWYSMPSPKIIYKLVEVYCRNINLIENPLLKAIVAHFLFSPIQAFEDGNWRTSRLLMNSILIKNNMQWKIVEDHDYRLEYLSQWRIHWDDKDKNKENIQKTFRKFLKYMLQINKKED